jgi:uncharacterized protein with NRDE domain
MCVVALALNQHPDWPILLVGNRDEFHARASAPLHAWDDDSGIIAGRDLVGGGTWLGVQPLHQRLAVITNVRSGGAPDPSKRSRGELVTGALTADGLRAVDGTNYNGFTLLHLHGAAATLTSNSHGGSDIALPAAIHAIANQPFGSPCPRAAALAKALAAALAAGGAANEAALFALLHAGHPMPYRPGEAAEQAFLRHETYGTRCSTIVRIDAAGRGVIAERRFDESGAFTGETRIGFAYRGAASASGG